MPEQPTVGQKPPHQASGVGLAQTVRRARALTQEEVSR